MTKGLVGHDKFKLLLGLDVIREQDHGITKGVTSGIDRIEVTLSTCSLSRLVQRRV